MSFEAVWQRYDEIERVLSAPLSERMLELADARSPARVIDIASGRGEPSIPAAQRLRPDGSVVGIDIDKGVLELAAQRAIVEKVENVEFINGDAMHVDRLTRGQFDIALSRWGFMYANEPTAVLSAVRRCLKPTGKIVVACWIKGASFYDLPRSIMGELTGIDFAGERAARAFAYSDESRLARDLNGAGFRVSYSESIPVTVVETASTSFLLEWFESFGLHDSVKDLPGHKLRQWQERVAETAESFREPDGMIRLGGVTRITVAHCD